MTDTPTLEIADLRTRIASAAGLVRAVDGVSFAIGSGEIFGLVGESGCGKSMTAFSVMRLLPPHAAIAGGSIRFRGTDLQALSENAMRDLRGDRIAMIFQDPMTALNPVFTIGEQIAEVLRRHRGLGRDAARTETVRMMDAVGIPAASHRFSAYPHEFSGGMRQRIMIAMALACAPDLLIADEPTTALDVTIEKQILALLQTLCRETGTAILLITHNLALAAEHCDRIAVMYAGQIVETAGTTALFGNPHHPYTQALLGAMPTGHISEHRLAPVTGLPPIITGKRAGCSFAPRCPQRFADCQTIAPELRTVTPDHLARCLLVEGIAS